MERLEFDVRGMDELKGLEVSDPKYVSTLDDMLDDVSEYEEKLEVIRTSFDKESTEMMVRELSKIKGVVVLDQLDNKHPLVSAAKDIISKHEPHCTVSGILLKYLDKPTKELQRQVLETHSRLQQDVNGYVEKVNEKTLAVNILKEGLIKAMYDLTEIVCLTNVPESGDREGLMEYGKTINSFSLFISSFEGSYESHAVINSGVAKLLDSRYTYDQLTNDNWVNEFREKINEVEYSGNISYIVRNPCRHTNSGILLAQGFSKIVSDFHVTIGDGDESSDSGGSDVLTGYPDSFQQIPGWENPGLN
ncbi:hypothetical protein GOV12_00710 [Candidatus Pacearchaeota archaeon]|nr:hypothetical protein [Candidatus Pacearchaeota archaeon]